jgi:hypothetical protein
MSECVEEMRYGALTFLLYDDGSITIRERGEPGGVELSRLELERLIAFAAPTFRQHKCEQCGGSGKIAIASDGPAVISRTCYRCSGKGVTGT